MLNKLFGTFHVRNPTSNSNLFTVCHQIKKKNSVLFFFYAEKNELYTRPKLGFLDENKILYTYQSGFRKHYSTDTCLSYLTDRLRNGFEKGLLTGMILIDLQKAFDTIDHSILFEKMKCLSFSESSSRWFTSYLSNRSFIVSV